MTWGLGVWNVGLSSSEYLRHVFVVAVAFVVQVCVVVLLVVVAVASCHVLLILLWSWYLLKGTWKSENI